MSPLLNVMLFLILPLFAVADENQCPAGEPLTFDQITPREIDKYVTAHPELQDPGDLLCCLPEFYRKNMAVAFGSIAGQNGTVHDPRVFAFAHKASEGGVVCALSINGGHPDQNQKMNMEMLCDNPEQKVLSLHDIDFAFHPGKMTNDPPLCMTCHGNLTGRYPQSVGPHANFDPGPWPRFLGGFDVGDFCSTPEENKMRAAADKAALEAIDKNPRYRCLIKDEKLIRGNLSNSFTLDLAINTAHTRRLSRLIRGSRDYETMKYVIMAVEVGCESTRKDFSGWIAPQWMREFSSKSTLHPNIAKAKHPYEIFNDMSYESYKKSLALRQKQLAIAEQIEKGQDPEFLVDESFTACMKHPPKPVEQEVTIPPLLGRYRFDQRARSFREQDFEELASLRFLIEGRGFNMGDWFSDAIPYLYRRPSRGALKRELLEAEPAPSPLKALQAEIMRNDRSGASKIHQQRICNKLRALSWQATNRPRNDQSQVKEDADSH